MSRTSSDQPFLEIARQPISFGEDWTTGIGGGLWSTGAALSHYLASPHAAEQVQKLVVASALRSENGEPAGVTCLELGSGNGLLAVCWMALLQSVLPVPTTDLPTVVVTDMADHLPLMQRTLDANPHIVQQAAAGWQVHVTEHVWGQLDKTEMDACLCDKTFDVILGSDVAYRPALYAPLIASLQQFSNARTTILLGCTMADTTPRFFDMLQEAGFVYERLTEQLLPVGFRGTIFGIFLVRRQARPTADLARYDT
jgi:predicted nicotinamide N-methyase